MDKTLRKTIKNMTFSYKKPWEDVFSYDTIDAPDVCDVAKWVKRENMNEKIELSTRNDNSDRIETICSAPITCADTYSVGLCSSEPSSVNIIISSEDLRKITGSSPMIAGNEDLCWNVKCTKFGSTYEPETIEIAKNTTLKSFKKDEDKDMPIKDDIMKFVWEKTPNSEKKKEEKEPDPTHRKYPKLVSDLKPKRIIFNNPATIVFWEDGTKTVVKLSKGEKFNSYNAFCAALAKKIFENNSRVRAIVKSGVNQHMKDANKKKTKKTSKNK